MASHKNLGRLAGFVFFINLIPYVIANTVILEELLYRDDFFQALQANRGKVAWAIVLQFVSITAMIAFAILIFPVLRKFGSRLALGYLGLRFVEFGLLVYSIIKLISLTDLGEMVFAEGVGDVAIQEYLAELMLLEWKWAGIIYMLVYALHCVIFFYLLSKSNIVPSLISWAGILGTILCFININNHLFDFSFRGFFLFLPMVLVELIIAIWLLIKGFEVAEN